MLSQEDKTRIIAELQTIKPGTTIEVLVNQQKKAVKFSVVRPTDGRFQCREKGQITWYGPEQYVGLPETPAPAAPAAEVKAEPEGGLVSLRNAWAEDMPHELEHRRNNCTTYLDFDDSVFFATTIAKEIIEDFSDTSHALHEELNSSDKGTAKDAAKTLKEVKSWLKKYGKEKPAEPTVLSRDEAGNPTVLMAEFVVSDAPSGKEALAEFKIGEFGSQVVIQIGALEAEQATNEQADDMRPISVALLAERMEENPKKVAAAFTSLNKGGFISQSGEKGARLIQLTALGWQYIETKKLSEYQVKAGFATAEPEVKAELKEAKPAFDDKILGALSAISIKGGLQVLDIFTANTIRVIAEYYPELIALAPATVEDAYFHAELTAGGYGILLNLAPEWALYTPESAPVAECQPPAEPQPEEPAKARRGRKASTSPNLRKNMGGEGHVKGKGGRPATGEKSLRQLALEHTQEILAKEEKISYKAIAPLLAEKLGMKVHPVQNVLLKLKNANFFVLNPAGQIANPVQLTDKGKAGYSTMHGQNIRGQVKELIAEELTDAQIARRLGCDLSYIHDVRTNRGVKMVEEAVTE
jgi:hypothetical protein